MVDRGMNSFGGSAGFVASRTALRVASAACSAFSLAFSPSSLASLPTFAASVRMFSFTVFLSSQAENKMGVLRGMIHNLVFMGDGG